MKMQKTSLVMVAALAAANVANAAILWDINDDVGGTDATVTDFIASGVTEDLSGATVSLVLGASSMTDGTITLNETTANGWAGPYPNDNSSNAILNDYLALRDGVAREMQIGGLSGQLHPNTTYSFYLWGAGDNSGQGSVFTFGGDTIQVSQDDPDDWNGIPPTDFLAKFSFTTGTTVSDTLEFTWDRSGVSRYGGLNGFAIVADIPAVVLPPTGLQATAGDLQVDLSWDVAPSAQSYKVYRAQDASGSDRVAIANDVLTTTYTDSDGLVANTPYFYVVTSVSNTAESVLSTQVSAIPFDGSDTTAPDAPSALGATIANSVAVVLDWDDTPAVDFSHFSVYRSDIAGGPFTNLVDTVTDSAHIDQAPSSEETYFYAVTATDYAGNESALSPEAVADLANRYIYEAEDFVDAAEGRTENTADVGGGLNVGWIDDGEYTTHLVDLPVAGDYRIDLRIARDPTGDSSLDILLEPDTNTVLGTAVIPNTRGWQTWETVSVHVTFPAAGVQTLRLNFAGGFNINWFELIPEIIGAELTAIDVTGQDLVLAWDAEAYKLYTVEETVDLSADPASWMPISGLTNLPGMAGTMVVTTTVSGADASAYRVSKSDVPPTALFETDFEDGAPGWSAGVDGDPDTEWQLGTPTTGPGAANSGTNCWATNLDTFYRTDANVWLRSPPIDISGAGSATLHYWQFQDNESFDPCVISVLDTSLNLIQEIVNNYGTSTEWEEREASLPVSAQPIILEFRFTSDNFIENAGWYLDDVTVTAP